MAWLTERLRSLWPVFAMDVLALGLDRWNSIEPEPGAVVGEWSYRYPVIAMVALVLAVLVVPFAVGWRRGRQYGAGDAMRLAFGVATMTLTVYVAYLVLGAVGGEPVADGWMLAFWYVTLLMFAFFLVLLMLPPWLGVVLGGWRRKAAGGTLTPD